METHKGGTLPKRSCDHSRTCSKTSHSCVCDSVLAVLVLLQLVLLAVGLAYVLYVTAPVGDVCTWWPWAVAISCLIFLLDALATSALLSGLVCARVKRAKYDYYVEMEERVMNSVQDGSSSAAPKPSMSTCCCWILGIFVVLLFVVIVALVVVVALYNPTTVLPTQLPGLYEALDIKYDVNGVPHITAQNVHDAFMGVALVHCRDRLWQMDMSRRLGLGSLSELLGSTALRADMSIHILGLNRAVERTVAALDDTTRMVMQAYVDGVNAYLATNPTLPLEYTVLGVTPRQWEIGDLIAWFKVIDMYMSHDLRRTQMFYDFLTVYGLSYERIMTLLPPVDRSAVPTAILLEDMANGHGPALGRVCPASETDPPAMIDFINSFIGQAAPTGDEEDDDSSSGKYFFSEFFFGGVKASNNWVVSGEFTGAGPILANDPHLTLSSPSVWYQLHLTIEDEQEIYGVTFPGYPFALLGKTNKFSWGVTNAGVDVQDLYLIDLDPSDSSRYMKHGVSYPFKVITEQIAVKDSSSYPVTVRLTQDDMPILTDMYMPIRNGPPIALKWACIDPSVTDTTPKGLYHLNLDVDDWASFKDAMSYSIGPVLNFVFASNTGDIGYHLVGRVPQRPLGFTGGWPVPYNGSYDWNGFIEFNDLPWTLNPPRGWIANANSMITPIGYEAEGCLMPGGWDAHFRQQRMDDVLAELVANANQHPVSVYDMQTLQMDAVAYRFNSLYPLFETLHQHPELLSDDSQEWVQRLLFWDSDSGIGSHEAAIFNSFLLELLRVDKAETGQDQWGNWFNAWMHIVNVFTGDEYDPGCGGDCLAYAAQAFNNAFIRVNSSTEWGVDVHKAYFLHSVMSSAPDMVSCMFNRNAEDGGDCATIQSGCPADSADFRCVSGPGMRCVFEFPGGDHFENTISWMNSVGNSGNPLSWHYDDLLGPWSDGGFTDPTTAAIETVFHIEPEY
ncbi:penicillin acylase family protein [Pelomyxa schiedti]|nr:penicillin acylase family protein [Pelomyxa schiedti]